MGFFFIWVFVGLVVVVGFILWGFFWLCVVLFCY